MLGIRAELKEIYKRLVALEEEQITVTLTNSIVPGEDRYKEALVDLVEYIESDSADRAMLTCEECKAAYEPRGFQCRNFNVCPRHPALEQAKELLE